MSYTSIISRVQDIHQLEDSSWFQTMANDTDTSTEEHRAIQAALRIYSADRPRRKVTEWASSGGDTWEYALATQVTGWDDDWVAEEVVFPASKQDRNIIDRNHWEVYKRPSDEAWYLRFLVDAPGSGDNIALRYIQPHVLSSTEDSITAENPGDVGVFELLAASECMFIAANYYARKHSTTVGADAVNYGSISEQYASRAKDMRRVYREHMRARRKTTGVSVDWDLPQIGGRERIRFPARLT